MKILIVYDSFFGNTGQIAKVISKFFGSDDKVELCHVNNVKTEKLKDMNLLIVGSPTRGFRPTKAISGFLKKIPSKGLEGIPVAAFDTRLDLNLIKSSVFRFFVNTGGYAANSIANQLVMKRGKLIVPPEGFLVTGEQGPLTSGEIERAPVWADRISKSICINSTLTD